ncbi:MAG: hypothetical protein MK212_04905 [Saprospiraceae bacterium]|nr:hypothetical protein [Saprospiraceae bacterium]
MKTLCALFVFIVSFLSVTLSSANSVKPLEDKKPAQLQASSLNNSVVLSWQTSSQFSDFCEIQKSKDGINFYTVDLVDQPSSVISYTDQTSEEGQYFYRVKFIGLDKQSQYSPTVSVMHKSSAKISLQRTIITDELNIHFDKKYKGNLSIAIVDQYTGQIVQQEELGFVEIASLTNLDLFVEGLEAGQYKIQIKGEHINDSLVFEKL